VSSEKLSLEEAQRLYDKQVLVRLPDKDKELQFLRAAGQHLNAARISCNSALASENVAHEQWDVARKKMEECDKVLETAKKEYLTMI